MKEILRDNFSSPCDKLVLMREVQQTILMEIEEFWACQGKTPANLQLDKGELLTILMYILVQSNTDDLFSQCNLMREFISG
jgi:hypothetical protein